MSYTTLCNDIFFFVLAVQKAVVVPYTLALLIYMNLVYSIFFLYVTHSNEMQITFIPLKCNYKTETKAMTDDIQI